MSIDSVQDILDYKFTDIGLLEQAFTHRSYLNEINHKNHTNAHNNERLEFLGDAVLELIVTNIIYNKFPTFSEGKLTALRASLVNTKTLGSLAKRLDFNSYLKLSKGERADTNERSRMPILADCFEAVLGAVFLDGGIEPCKKLIHKHLEILIEDILKTESFKDAKSRLQEIYQSSIKSTPQYSIIKEEGKEHDKVFTMGVSVNGIMLSSGIGRSKQEAEVNAASNALEKAKLGKVDIN